MVCMGNGTQSLLPLIVAVCFAWFRRDWPAAGSASRGAARRCRTRRSTSPTRRTRRCTLLKENSIHDWAYVLGAEQFYALDKAGLIATCVKDVDSAFLVVGFGFCVVPAFLAWRAGPLPRRVGGGAGVLDRDRGGVGRAAMPVAGVATRKAGAACDAVYEGQGRLRRRAGRRTRVGSPERASSCRARAHARVRGRRHGDALLRREPDPEDVAWILVERDAARRRALGRLEWSAARRS